MDKTEPPIIRIYNLQKKDMVPKEIYYYNVFKNLIVKNSSF